MAKVITMCEKAHFEKTMPQVVLYKNATIYWEFLTLLFFMSRSPEYFLETVVVSFSKCVFACMNEIYVYACLPAYILFIYDLLKRLHHKISRS